MKNKIATFALITAALTAGSSTLMAALTDNEELTLVKATVPYALRLAATSAWPTSGTSPTTDELDGAKFGQASETAASQTYWYNDSDTDVYTMSSVGNAWRTFKLTGIAASWSATTTATFTETVRNGAAGPGSPYTLELTFTKTGSPADLTKSEVLTFLLANKIIALTTTSGTGTSLGTIKTGWVATALVKDGAAAAAASTLDPMSASFTLPLTIGGTSRNLTTTVAKMIDWNLTTGSTTKKSVTFSTTGYSMTLEFQPSQFARTAGISSGIVTAARTLENRIVAQSTSNSIYGLYNRGTDVVALLKAKTVGTDNKALDQKVLDDAVNKVTASSFDGTKFTNKSLTTADSGNWGFVAFGGTDVTSATWNNDDTKVQITGTIGTGQSKIFEVDLAGLQVIDSSTNNVLTFKAKDGSSDAIILKCFLGTALDSSGVAGVSAAFKSTILAGYVVNALSAVATIKHAALDELN